jgi:hypothetical protein
MCANEHKEKPTEDIQNVFIFKLKRGLTYSR